MGLCCQAECCTCEPVGELSAGRMVERSDILDFVSYGRDSRRRRRHSDSNVASRLLLGALRLRLLDWASLTINKPTTCVLS